MHSPSLNKIRDPIQSMATQVQGHEPQVRDYMTSALIHVPMETRLDECISIMSDNKIGNLVVAENALPAGILTEREILHHLATSGRIPDKSVKEIALQDFVSISPDATVLDAARAMISKKSRLLVFEGESCVGIITASDLVRAFMKTGRDPSLEEVISKDVSTLQSYGTILDAVKVMNRRRIGSVIVLADNGFHVGIFTERDLLKILSKGGSLDERVAGHCSPFMVTAQIGIRAREAADIMAANRIKRLPLTKEDGRIAGIVTARDLVDAFQKE